jgi:hypothetical protein
MGAMSLKLRPRVQNRVYHTHARRKILCLTTEQCLYWRPLHEPHIEDAASLGVIETEMPNGITILFPSANFKKRRTHSLVSSEQVRLTMQIFILWLSEQGTSIDVPFLILKLMGKPSGMNIAKLGCTMY